MTRLYASSSYMPGTHLLLLCALMAFFILGLILGSAMKCPCSVQVRSYPWAFVHTYEDAQEHRNTELSILDKGQIGVLDELRNIHRHLNVIRKPRVFTKDLSGWRNNFSICGNFPKFKMYTMNTRVGKTPICIHEYYFEPFQNENKGNSFRLTKWELKLQSIIFNLLDKDERIQFIEFGANVGIYSLAVAKYGRNVIAVNSQNVNVERLCSSVIFGNFTENVTLIYDPLPVNFIDRQEQNDNAYTSLDDVLHIPDYNFDVVILKIDSPYISKMLEKGERFFKTVNVVHVLVNWSILSLAADRNDVVDFFSSRYYVPYHPFDQQSMLDTAKTHQWPSVVLWKNTYSIK